MKNHVKRKMQPKLKASGGGMKKKKLKSANTANTLAYVVPPLILVAIFGYCATHPFVPAEKTKVEEVVTTPSKTPTSSAAPTIVKSEPADINNNLPDYQIAASEQNVINAAKVSQSGSSKDCVAANAVNGSTANDGRVAQALAAGGKTWWKAEFAKAEAVNTIVIYGGGSASPVGKLKGGFEVAVQSADGQSYTKRFCEEGFALEGYEAWKLDAPTTVSSITITSLDSKNALVLREVQAIGTK